LPCHHHHRRYLAEKQDRHEIIERIVALLIVKLREAVMPPLLVTSNACPSGADLATASTPSTSSAPGLFSMMTDFPHDCDKARPITRARMSVVAPDWSNVILMVWLDYDPAPGRGCWRGAARRGVPSV
jgi:hypothetical protein